MTLKINDLYTLNRALLAFFLFIGVKLIDYDVFEKQNLYCTSKIVLNKLVSVAFSEK